MLLSRIIITALFVSCLFAIGMMNVVGGAAAGPATSVAAIGTTQVAAEP